jgi:Cu(I)/Ag(I) efflux system membrane fusion protein
MSNIRVPTSVLIGATVAIVAVALAAGYWLGARRGEHFVTTPVPATAMAVPNASVKQADGTPLYYQDPDGKADYSPMPKKTTDGRDFVAVYEEGGAGSPGNVASAPSAPEGKGRLLYYRNPMGLPDTSPVPKKDSMGMAYLPVYENEALSDSGIVQVSPGHLQMLGVRTAPVELRKNVGRTLHASGVVQVDERSQSVVTVKVAGWIEKLNVAATGEPVRQGQPLFELYSPDLVAAEQEFLIAAQMNFGDRADHAHVPAEAITEAALQRLRAFDVPEDEIARLRRTGVVTRRIAIPAPASGVVLEKQAVEGMHIDPGMPLYKIADLSTVWLIADVQEQDLGSLRVGASAHATFVSYPGRNFAGRVEFIYPTLSTETRTARARIIIKNPGFVLRPAMYATLDIDIPETPSARSSLVVPESAVIDSGNRQTVLVDRGEGRFEPRAVAIGARGNGFVEVLEGVKEGESVVTSANFLIDAESNLRAALSSFASGPSNTAAPTPTNGPKP